jgi:hypothetical protein
MAIQIRKIPPARVQLLMLGKVKLLVELTASPLLDPECLRFEDPEHVESKNNINQGAKQM